MRLIPDKTAISTTDEQLFELYRSGDERAFGQLHARYEPVLRSYFGKRLHASDAIPDLIQTTFLRIHRGRHSYDASYRLSSWIFTIASNLLKNEYRRMSRRREITFSSLVAPDEGRPRPLEFSDPDATPTKDLARSETLAAILEAFAGLSVDHREALVLKETGHSFEEVASLLGIPTNTAKSRVIRARQAFAGRYHGPTLSDLARAS